MKYTSAEAVKLLRKLNEEKENLLSEEGLSSSFLASIGEDVESVRPTYDYAKTQESIREIDKKIRTLKHAINKFNISTEVPGTGMTVDQVLILIPQLTSEKIKLWNMQSKLPKQRERSSEYNRSGSNIIDYRYANYDIETAKKDYMTVSDELAKVQTALDLVNSTETMEIDI